MANVTIDDTDPSIVYLPASWNARNASVPCPTCNANPQADMMYNETWHDNTFSVLPGSSPFPNIPITASVLFNGTALYVFCALAESSYGNSDMSFYIDGELKGTFVRNAPDVDLYQYNVPVFTIEGLTPEEHNFTLQGGHVNSNQSLILLDKMIYTAFDSTSTSSSLDSTLASPSIDSIPVSSPSDSTFTFSSLNSRLTSSPIPSSHESSSHSSSHTFTSTSSTSTPSSSGESVTTSKKTLWSIIGPAVAVTIVVLLLIAIVLWFFFKRKRQQWYNGKKEARTLNPYSLEYSNSGSLASPTLRPHKCGRRAGGGPGHSKIQPQTSYFTSEDMSAEALNDNVQADAPPAYHEIERFR